MDYPPLLKMVGGETDTGRAVIITGSAGEPVKPMSIPRGYSNGNHAVFIAKVGMHILCAIRGDRFENVSCYRIIAIGSKNNPDALVTEEIVGNSNAPDIFEPAIKAALSKINCYNCRKPHYISD